ncbi:hypothetical protein RRG08_025647 [Elysia crispata]|uniref:Uncharacterized protein n=1 Tax=Elysia crispata TaxID=231223 RepID=A0AAE1CXA3_9GAST|nr:hypothetical protein RRG08_025647 [Elysia crispata]
MITGLLWLDSLTTAQEARQASSDDCSRGCHCRSSAGKQKQGTAEKLTRTSVDVRKRTRPSDKPESGIGIGILWQTFPPPTVSDNLPKVGMKHKLSTRRKYPTVPPHDNPEKAWEVLCLPAITQLSL